ncbi:TM2 domain-containing protein [Actinomyces sp. MRS3W]|uniref:TM2 domain-containing protein n=1 Tax=Actinomyces sp. MRS3W TaxID=2800796 RepID=UPI0028FD2333|nr:TM2 domain-containing protein [Actinomyces sp. MRS3W]MDU0348487.1 TM2 domain-containing protein [Actinomyces sp. MRS3W]
MRCLAHGDYYPAFGVRIRPVFCQHGSMTSSPFTAPEPQNNDGSYGASVQNSALSADYPQGYAASSGAETATDPYRQLDTYSGAQGWQGSAYPPGYEQAQQAAYQSGYGAPSNPGANYQQAPYQQQGYPGAGQQPGYQAPGYQQAGYGAPAAAYPQPYATYDQKSKVAAGLLGIFFGGLGIHNFYLGQTGKAVGQLCLTLGGLLLLIFFVGFFMMLAAQFWGLIEGIIILCSTSGVHPWGVDARGVPLRG